MAFQARVRDPVGTPAGTDIATSSSKTWVASATAGSSKIRSSSSFRNSDRSSRLQPPTKTLVVDPKDLRVRHLRVEQDLDAGVHQAFVVVPERGCRVRRRRLAGRDEAHPDATPRGGEEAREDRSIADVRIDDVDPPPRLVDRGLDGVADRVVAGTRHVPQDRRRDAARRLRRDLTRPTGTTGRGLRVRHRAALVPPAREEHELELVHDRARHPTHDVVEALVVVVVLDAAAADVAIRPSMTAILRWSKWRVSSRRSAGRAPRRAGPSGRRDAVVGDDLIPAATQIGEQVLAPEVDLAADRIDLEADLDTVGDLRRQSSRKVVPISPGL